MRRILIITGVLGGGTALTFAAAVLASQLFPNGTVVTTYGGSQVLWDKVNAGVGVGGGKIVLPAPVPIDANGVMILTPAPVLP